MSLESTQTIIEYCNGPAEVNIFTHLEYNIAIEKVRKDIQTLFHLTPELLSAEEEKLIETIVPYITKVINESDIENHKGLWLLKIRPTSIIGYEVGLSYNYTFPKDMDGTILYGYMVNLNQRKRSKDITMEEFNNETKKIAAIFKKLNPALKVDYQEEFNTDWHILTGIASGVNPKDIDYYIRVICPLLNLTHWFQKDELYKSLRNKLDTETDKILTPIRKHLFSTYNIDAGLSGYFHPDSLATLARSFNISHPQIDNSVMQNIASEYSNALNKSNDTIK